MTPKRLKMVLLGIKQTILTFFLEILDLEGHQNRCIGSKVTAIFLNGWILPTGGVEGSAPAACAAGLFRAFLQFVTGVLQQTN